MDQEIVHLPILHRKPSKSIARRPKVECAFVGIVEEEAVGALPMHTDEKGDRCIQRVGIRAVAKMIGIPVHIGAPALVEWSCLFAQAQKPLTRLQALVDRGLLPEPLDAKCIVFLDHIPLQVAQANPHRSFPDLQTQRLGLQQKMIFAIGKVECSFGSLPHNGIGKIVDDLP